MGGDQESWVLTLRLLFVSGSLAQSSLDLICAAELFVLENNELK